MQPRFSRRRLFFDLALARATWAELSGQTHSHPGAAPAAPRTGFLTPAQAAIVGAMAAQIIPTDDTPGAREAGVVHFISLALATFESDKQAAYVAGLKPLAGFAGLSVERQVEMLRAIEKSEFFDLVRTHTIMGYLSHPQYGGNRGSVGWKTIGFQDAYTFRPPFGWYDGPEGSR
jgi:gluconate 2-dehydrogenase gamma chain